MVPSSRRQGSRIKRSKQDRLGDFGSRDATPVPDDDYPKPGKGLGGKKKNDKHKKKRKNTSVGNVTVAGLPSGLPAHVKEQAMIYLQNAPAPTPYGLSRKPPAVGPGKASVRPVESVVLGRLKPKHMGNGAYDPRNPQCTESKQVLRAQGKKYVAVMRTDPTASQSNGDMLEDLKLPQSRAHEQEASAPATLPSPGFSVQPLSR